MLTDLDTISLNQDIESALEMIQQKHNIKKIKTRCTFDPSTGIIEIYSKAKQENQNNYLINLLESFADKNLPFDQTLKQKIQNNEAFYYYYNNEKLKINNVYFNSKNRKYKIILDSDDDFTVKTTVTNFLEKASAE